MTNTLRYVVFFWNFPRVDAYDVLSNWHNSLSIRPYLISHTEPANFDLPQLTLLYLTLVYLTLLYLYLVPLWFNFLFSANKLATFLHCQALIRICHFFLERFGAWQHFSASPKTRRRTRSQCFETTIFKPAFFRIRRKQQLEIVLRDV